MSFSDDFNSDFLFFTSSNLFIQVKSLPKGSRQAIIQIALKNRIAMFLFDG